MSDVDHSTASSVMVSPPQHWQSNNVLFQPNLRPEFAPRTYKYLACQAKVYMALVGISVYIRRGLAQCSTITGERTLSCVPFFQSSQEADEHPANSVCLRAGWSTIPSVVEFEQDGLCIRATLAISVAGATSASSRQRRWPRWRRIQKPILLKLDENLKERMVNTMEWTSPRTGIRNQQVFIRRARSQIPASA